MGGWTPTSGETAPRFTEGDGPPAASLEIRGVRHRFTGRRPVDALGPIDLQVGANEFVSIVGTSGCGKSTLLSIVAGLLEPTEGEVLVDGIPIRGPGRDRGVVFQSYTLFPWLTARENIEFALQGEGLSRAERRRIADEHLELVGLRGFGDAYPRQLSGGMKQRVAIARALCYRPRILLMDEPFGALDAQMRLLMQELLVRIWEAHRLTVLFVTHDVEEAVYVSDRVVVLTNRPGRVKEETVIDLPRPRRPEVQETKAFLALRHRILRSIRDETMRAEPGVEGPI